MGGRISLYALNHNERTAALARVARLMLQVDLVRLAVLNGQRADCIEGCAALSVLADQLAGVLEPGDESA